VIGASQGKAGRGAALLTVGRRARLHRIFRESAFSAILRRFSRRAHGPARGGNLPLAPRGRIKAARSEFCVQSHTFLKCKLTIARERVIFAPDRAAIGSCDAPRSVDLGGAQG